MMHLGEKRIRELGREANEKKKVRDMKVEGYDWIQDYMNITQINLSREMLIKMGGIIKEEISDKSPDYIAGYYKGQWNMYHHIEKLMESIESMVLEARNIEFEKLLKREEKKRREWRTFK